MKSAPPSTLSFSSVNVANNVANDLGFEVPRFGSRQIGEGRRGYLKGEGGGRVGISERGVKGHCREGIGGVLGYGKITYYGGENTCLPAHHASLR